MGLLDGGAVTRLFAGVACSLVLVVVTVALGLVGAASAFAAALSGTPLLVALLDAAVPYVAAALVTATLSVLLLVGTVVAAIRRASLPRSRRLARLARLVERASAGAREFGLAERFEPTTEERIDDLKREYVEGEITELEYERRLAELLDEGGAGDGRPRREPSRTDRELEL